jgi:hypothetical protein
MTPELWQKVFGYNASKPYNLSIEEMKKKAGSDAVTRHKLAYDRPNRSFHTYRPRTRRDF